MMLVAKARKTVAVANGRPRGPKQPADIAEGSWKLRRVAHVVPVSLCARQAKHDFPHLTELPFSKANLTHAPR